MAPPQDMLDLGIRPGEVLAGKYRVDRVLGAGGMGAVVAAHHVQLETRVAIKFLLPTMLSNLEAVSRFAREARAAVRITSEHVARVIDVGTLETGAPYMVMEYLEGGDLAAWLQERGALPLEQAVEFVLQASVAVAEAHSLGIVHRDLKPANLFCIRRPDGQLSIKVLDFGISKDTGRGLAPGSNPPLSVTKTSAVMGSPLYMSPEQMRSAKGVDARSDIWALGVALYELLAGRVPFDGEAATEVVVKVTTQPPPPLRGFRPDVPAGLEAVVFRCLEKNREARYRDVAELAVALAEFAPSRARASIERITNTIQAAGLSVTALAVPPSPRTPEAIGSPGTMVPVGRTAPGIPGLSSRKWFVVGLTMAAITIAGTGAVLLTGTRVASHPAVSAPSVATLAPTSLRSPPAPEAEAPPQPAESATARPIIDTVPPPPTRSPGPPSTPSPRSSPHSADVQVRPVAPPTPAEAAPAKPNCDPPYYYTAKGTRTFKPECL
jgi:tRNA A-37 threonylcarbamoyl transferase component Bud32